MLCPLAIKKSIVIFYLKKIYLRELSIAFVFINYLYEIFGSVTVS